MSVKSEPATPTTTPSLKDFSFEETEPTCTVLEPNPKEPSAKRKISSVSSASPSPNSCSKSLRTKSPPHSKMSAEEVAALKLSVVSVQSVLGQILQQGKDAKVLGEETKATMIAMDRETKALVAENTQGLKDLREAQIEQNHAVDSRLTGVETEVANLKEVIRSGQLGSLEGQSCEYNHEVAHESKLRAMINDSKRCVTLLGAADPEMDLEKLLQAMRTSTLKCPGHAKEIFHGIFRLGSATSTDPPYKIEMDCEASAESLIDQSRERSRRHRNAKTNTPLTGIRFVKHYPQEYSQAAKSFRTMQSLVYDHDGLSAIEYEGTTLTLKARSRQPGGQWIIMRGGEFRPLAVGRSVPQESEKEGMTKARILMDAVLDNRPDSALARSLYLNTKTSLGTLTLIKAKLGTTLSEGLLTGDQKSRSDAKTIYTCTYDTREVAIKALQLSRKLTELTDSTMVEGEDWLTLVIPVVGR